MLLKLILLFICLSVGSLNAEYIKFGGGVGSNGDTSTIDINALSVGFYSFLDWDYQDRMTIGVSLSEQGGGFKTIYNVATNSSDYNSYSALITPILDSSSLTMALFTIDFDLFAEGGLYMFSGIGYGVDLRVRETTATLARIADSVDNAEDIDSLVNDQQFINDITSIANDDILYNLLNSLLPNSSIASQVDTAEEIINLVNDQQALEAFLSTAQNDYNATYPNGFDINNVNGGAVALSCGTSLTCKSGLAYQLGVGYTFVIYSVVNLDFYTKVSGIVGSHPYYSGGANLMFKF